MKKPINKILTLLFGKNLQCGVIILFATFFSSTAFALPRIQTWLTKSGVPVYFIQTHSTPMLLASLLFNAGSAYDGSNSGLAALTNALFGLGTDKLSEQEIADQFANVGANFNQISGRNFAVLSLRCLSSQKSLDTVVPLFNQVLTQLNFSAASFSRARQQLQASIKSEQQDPGEVANKTFYKALYGMAPYAQPVLGSLDSVKTLTKHEVLNFYHHYYTGHNATVLLVGDITKIQAYSIAAQLVKGLPGGKRYRLESNAQPAKPKIIKVKFPSNQATVLLGNLSAPLHSSDHYALVVGNYILGGSGLTSLLVKQVRERYGLSYAVSSGFDSVFGLRPFVISFQTKLSSTQQAIDVAQHTLMSFLQKGPSQAELQATKNYLIGSFLLGLDSNAKLMNVLTSMVQFHYPLDYLQNYRQRIAAVTTADVKAAMNKYINPRQLVTVIVG